MADVDVLNTLKQQRAKIQDELGELEGELRRVDAAIAAYQSNRGAGRGKTTRRRRGGGRKKGSKQSAATKRKISRAMKKRWAERKKS